MKRLNHNVETGEITEVEITKDELAQYEADQAAYAVHLAEAETKAAARQAILDRLGLTEEEAALLLK